MSWNDLVRFGFAFCCGEMYKVKFPFPAIHWRLLCTCECILLFLRFLFCFKFVRLTFAHLFSNTLCASNKHRILYSSTILVAQSVTGGIIPHDITRCHCWARMKRSRFEHFYFPSHALSFKPNKMGKQPHRRWFTNSLIPQSRAALLLRLDKLCSRYDIF